MKVQPVRIFISHDMDGADAAADVARRLSGAGAIVFDVSTVTAGGVYGDAMRRAIRESEVVVAVVTANRLSANVMFELGAASGAGKQIIVLTSGVTSVDLPASFADVPMLPVARATEVIRFVRGTVDAA
jgi:hypothetical protein